MSYFFCYKLSSFNRNSLSIDIVNGHLSVQHYTKLNRAKLYHCPVLSLHMLFDMSCKFKKKKKIVSFFVELRTIWHLPSHTH